MHVAFFSSVNAQYQTSYNSCWPIWGDNHYCYDSYLPRRYRTHSREIRSQQGQGRLQYVHPFKMPSGPPPGRRRQLEEGGGGAFCNGYFGEPSGWQFQLDGQHSNCPQDAEQFMPNHCCILPMKPTC
jgi:hypothetical protein